MGLVKFKSPKGGGIKPRVDGGGAKRRSRRAARKRGRAVEGGEWDRGESGGGLGAERCDAKGACAAWARAALANASHRGKQVASGWRLPAGKWNPGAKNCILKVKG